MFGLRLPLAKTSTSADFDGVQAILYNSSLREPSDWLSRVNEKGELFLLSLEGCDEPDLSSTDVTEKDCFCSCSDCATDDTGYGTDTDLHSSFRKGDDDLRPYQTKQILTEFNDIDDVLNINTDSSFFDDPYSRTAGEKGSSSYYGAEENIDSLFKSVHLDQKQIETFTAEGDLIPSNINAYFCQNNASKSKKNRSHTGMSAMTDVPTSNGHVGASTKSEYVEVSNFSEARNTNKSCECSAKSDRTIKSDVHVTVKLRSRRNVSEDLTTVELCELILGFIPGHYGSSQAASQHHRRRDRRIKIRSVMPTGVASKYCDIHAGDCLVSINDQDVSWDNLKSVLQVLLHQRQAKLALRRSSKQKSSTTSSSVLVKKRAQSATSRMVQLVTGSNSSTCIEDVLQSDWEPFYGALYLSLEGVSSDNMQAKEDIVYQFPGVDNKVVDSRGIFITLAGTVTDATQSTIRSTHVYVDGRPVNVVYHCDGKNLFVVSIPEHRYSIAGLTSLVQDLVRLLQITHGSIHQAFTSHDNHSQLDCFFALLHHSHISQTTDCNPVHTHNCNLSQSVKILPLPNEIKVSADNVLTEFEAADFGDMSDSYYGCRRSFSILGTCLFYKDYLMVNHLPKDDLVDFATYLKYHSLLSLTTDQSLGQLVVWREVHPTRHCHSVPEEQSFGYTEPLIARWFWLIVGYKNLIMCIMMETGGCTSITEGISTLDPFMIDQARTVLMQLDGQGVSQQCSNSITNPACPLVTRPDLYCQKQDQRHDLLSRSLKKLPHKDSSHVTATGHVIQSNQSAAGSFNENHGSLRRILQKRKDSFGSDNSSESSGDSFFKFSRKGRLFPDTDLLQNISESREDIGPVNTNRKLTVGVENCLFHYQYHDNLEGVVISSTPQEGGVSLNVGGVSQNKCGVSQLNEEIYESFQKCCQQIKNVFDNARKIKEQYKEKKTHILELNDDFSEVREEGVMFTCHKSSQDKKSQPLNYWVVGRCLSRSLRREVFVCFHESTPQTAIELAFKLALGYLPL